LLYYMLSPWYQEEVQKEYFFFSSWKCGDVPGAGEAKGFSRFFIFKR